MTDRDALNLILEIRKQKLKVLESDKSVKPEIIELYKSDISTIESMAK